MASAKSKTCAPPSTGSNVNSPCPSSSLAFLSEPLSDCAPRIPTTTCNALIALGLPAVAIENRVYDFEFLRQCAKPKLFVSGSRDQFGPAGKLEALVNTFADPKKLVRIEAGDHFFEGRLKEMRTAIEDWVREIVSAQTNSD
jgi:fermentation-respiration switch protein FrsA (DUF1100 family)